MDPVIRIQSKPFDSGAEIARVSAGAGAVATFTGHVRGDGGLTALRLEHYPGMTEREITRCVEEAARRWSLLGVTVIHRIGEMRPGDPIVLVAVASLHRREAFAACEFLMDQLKTAAPFWKEEKKGADLKWVEAKASDDDAAARWSSRPR
jgi:molybdopterin synthase catalytic subunit